MADEPNESAIHRVDTVPPPDGEGDAYSAPTKIGPMAAAVVEEMLIAAARQPTGFEGYDVSGMPSSGGSTAGNESSSKGRAQPRLYEPPAGERLAPPRLDSLCAPAVVRTERSLAISRLAVAGALVLLMLAIYLLMRSLGVPLG